MATRRVDVTVFSLLFILGGAAFLSLSGALLPRAFRTAWEYDCGAGFTWVFLLGTCGLFGAVAGAGMLKLKRWAYVMGLVAGTAFIAGAILSLKGGIATPEPAVRTFCFWFSGISLPVGSAVLWFLIRRPTRSQFFPNLPTSIVGA